MNENERAIWETLYPGCVGMSTLMAESRCFGNGLVMTEDRNTCQKCLEARAEDRCLFGDKDHDNASLTEFHRLAKIAATLYIREMR